MLNNTIQLSLEENGICRVTIDHAKVAEISPNGDIVTFRATQWVGQHALAIPRNSGPFISDDFKTVSMYGTGLTTEDGKLLVAPQGTIKVMLPGQRPPAIGERTQNGIYIGRYSGKDGEKRDWYADTRDIQGSTGNRLALDFNASAVRIKSLQSLGFDDWIMPPGWNDRRGRADVLKAIVNCRNTGAFEGTFDESTLCNALGSALAAYWSGSSMGYGEGDRAMIQVIGNGRQSHANKSQKFFVRAVRSIKV